MKILFLGDIVGRPGRDALKKHLAAIREEEGLSLVFANGENASAGIGLSKKNARELLNCGVDVLTTGNHVWKFKDLHNLLQKEGRIIRPANFPTPCPGKGFTIVEKDGLQPVAVVNVQGRVFMPPMDCPFNAMDRVLAEIGDQASIILVDMHAEATGEKTAMGWYLDGRVSAVVGTHTHVQTNDAVVLPQGTGYISDLGRCGPRDSCLGMRPAEVIQRFTTGLPNRLQVANGPVILQGAIFDIDESTGSTKNCSIWNKLIQA